MKIKRIFVSFSQTILWLRKKKMEIVFLLVKQIHVWLFMLNQVGNLLHGNLVKFSMFKRSMVCIPLCAGVISLICTLTSYIHILNVVESRIHSIISSPGP